MTIMDTAHVPIRTCVGCRGTATQDEMLRITRAEWPAGAQPVLRVDLDGSAPGRGAWIHPTSTCLDNACHRGGFSRSFRGPVDTSRLAHDVKIIHSHHLWKR